MTCRVSPNAPPPPSSSNECCSGITVEQEKNLAEALEKQEVNMSQVCIKIMKQQTGNLKTEQARRALQEGLNMYGFGGLTDTVQDQLKKLFEAEVDKMGDECRNAVKELKEEIEQRVSDVAEEFKDSLAH